MSARVLAIGLDAASATLVGRWTDRGYLPNIAALRKRAAVFRLDAECMETLPGAIWSDISYGEPAQKHGHFYHPTQFSPRSGMPSPLRDEEIVSEHLFWQAASDQGLRCAVVDVPFMPLLSGFNGVQIRELAIHDHAFGFKSSPPEVMEDFVARYGEPPMHGRTCDIAAEVEGRTVVSQMLRRRARYKTSVLMELMQREPWDLFFAVMGDCHCGTHYLWPLRDSEGKWVSPVEGTSDIWEPLREIYRLMDEGVGQLIDAAGPDAKIILFSSHGVGTYLGGPQLIGEVLRRTHLSDGWDWPGRRQLRASALRLRNRTGARLAEEMPLAKTSVLVGLRAFLGATRLPQAYGRCKAYSVSNNRIGAVSVNLAGRERHGTVTASEAPAVLDEVTRLLERLEDPVTGQRLVKYIERTEDLYGSSRAATLPDLIVKFHANLGPLDRAWSPATGHFHVPNEKPYYRRSGDHVPQARAWVCAGDYPVGASGRGNVLDLGPTILELAGVERPPHMTGTPLNSHLTT